MMYNDTINFLLTAEEGGKSTSVTAFSISQIAGAYGDEGQNYYNIVQLFDSIRWKSGKFYYSWHVVVCIYVRFTDEYLRMYYRL